MKTCGRCKVEKDLEDFARKTTAKDGRQSWCRACNTITRTEWARANRGRTQAHTRYSKYRLREEDFQALIDKQDNKCAVCEEVFTRTPLIDHNHACCPYEQGRTCGKCVRGLLCGRCNTFVGFVETGNHFAKIEKYLGL